MRRSEDYNRRILEAIASGERITQRLLAREMGVALGLTNLLIRRLVRKGYVRMSKMGTRHVRYLMTPTGVDALAQATRRSLENTVRLYTHTREQIRTNLDEVSMRCPRDAAGCKRIVFYGAGDVAEIAYVSLQRTDLTLVGVVDDLRTGRFFHVTISNPDELRSDNIGGVAYSHLVVTTIAHADRVRSVLEARGIPQQCVSFL